MMELSESNTLHLPILIEQDEDNYFIVSCPVFKACHSYGETIEKALENIKEVIEICIEEERANETPSNRFIGFREMEITIQNKSA